MNQAPVIVLDTAGACAAAGNISPRTLRLWLAQGLNGRKLKRVPGIRRVLIKPEWLSEFLGNEQQGGTRHE